MQNMMMFADAIRGQGAFYLPLGESRVSWVDARDIALIGAKALTEAGHENVAYPLTGSEALTYSQVAAMMTEELGRPISYSDPSPLAFARRMRERGYASGYINVMNGIYLTTRLGRAAAIHPAAAQLLGRPPITMRQYVRDYANAFVRMKEAG